MGCEPEKEVDKYVFFKNIENYIDKVNNAKSSSGGGVFKCNTFSAASGTWFKDNKVAKSVCDELIKLYKSIDSLKNMSKAGTNYENDCRFFNYWVNFKINRSMVKENQCIEDVYNGIESHGLDDSENQLEVGIIYHINEDDLYKMNILYNLYENYVKLNVIDYKNGQQDKQQLLIHSTACCTDYIKASYICNHDNKKKNPIFCEKLEAFESKYKQLNQKVVEQGSDFSDYFIKLSECPNNKIITTAVTGTVVGLIPLLGVLYKFTPMGQMFRSNKGIVNNIISNNDDEITNISLMEHENEQLRFQKGKYNIKYQSL